MAVEELMRILRTYPADLRVVVDGYEEGYDDLGADLVSLQEIAWTPAKHGGKAYTATLRTHEGKAAPSSTPWRCAAR